MKRLTTLLSWKRLGLQAGLLSGLGLAFMAADAPEAEATGGLCRGEDECSFKKPNFMLVLDYSTSMNNAFGSSTIQSRWDAAVDAINQLVTFQNGFFDENSHVALLRFGHDPDPGSPGTTITQDVNSGTPAPIVDGFSLDVGWYDPADLANNPWLECNGAAITSALAALPGISHSNTPSRVSRGRLRSNIGPDPERDNDAERAWNPTKMGLFSEGVRE